jgi:hypothetical protein
MLPKPLPCGVGLIALFMLIQAPAHAEYDFVQPPILVSIVNNAGRGAKGIVIRRVGRYETKRPRRECPGIAGPCWRTAGVFVEDQWRTGSTGVIRIPAGRFRSQERGRRVAFEKGFVISIPQATDCFVNDEPQDGTDFEITPAMSSLDVIRIACARRKR